MADTPQPDRFELDSVHTGLLDCVQVNLAVLADHAHGPGTHLRLGAPLRFAWWPGDDGLPTADPPLEVHLDAAATLLGLRPARKEQLARGDLLDPPRWDGGTHYVVADAYDLPWLPYHGQAHMDHSFLLSAGPGGWHVTDAYRVETRWGAAVPGSWVLSPHELAGIGPAEVIAFEAVPPPPVAALPPTAYTAGDPDAEAVESYLAAYEACADRALVLERLTAETWLLARARKLHVKYRARHAGREEDEAERDLLGAWDTVVEQTYLAHRRVSRGRAEPPCVVDRLRAVLADEVKVLGEAAPGAAVDPAGGPGEPSGEASGRAEREALRRRVAAVAAAVLGVAEEPLLHGAEFASYASFSSFRLIEIIERLEAELGHELEAGELVPENLRRVDDLCRIAR
ncbi:hypothetical protein HHX38_18950 [Streptomyces sp. PKU-MA01144]|uniref:hypothetical protein n=1 Tax=Streptomyces sp. PKU-MA01144 TaxID=2729138 RepID=UPI001479A59F|nr:hypothetical protein [Streptomyces sp. PKU-MA01144]NNJ06187.1 hypothetical protein [Streptomyces sp. PKU-MA01144]